MRRIILISVSICLLLFTFGCENSGSSLRRPATFYYCNKTVNYQGDSPIIHAEERETDGFEDDLVGLLNYYMEGPASKELISPFPQFAEVTQARTNGAVLTIVLNDRFDTLPTYNLTLALGCLCRTILGYIPVHTIIVKANETFSDGSAYKSITASSFLYSDAQTPYDPPQ